MRRTLAVLVALVLVGLLASSSLAATSRSSFKGDFDLVSGDETVLGHIKAQLDEPTDQHLETGFWDGTSAPGSSVRESHATLATASFWYDPNHMPDGATIPGGRVARGEGFECVYYAPNEAECHRWIVTFVDNVDPTVRDEVRFEGDWEGTVTQFVGEGTFVVKLGG